MARESTASSQVSGGSDVLAILLVLIVKIPWPRRESIGQDLRRSGIGRHKARLGMPAIAKPGTCFLVLARIPRPSVIHMHAWIAGEDAFARTNDITNSLWLAHENWPTIDT
jgi:hypothetical protein